VFTACCLFRARNARGKREGKGFTWHLDTKIGNIFGDVHIRYSSGVKQAKRGGNRHKAGSAPKRERLGVGEERQF